MKSILIAAALLLAADRRGPAQELPFDASASFLAWPAGLHPGEIAGVATTSKGHLLVYTRTGEQATAGASRIFTHGGSRLFEFDSAGKFSREIGQGVYAFLFAQAVRVDAKDNIWIVDRGSDMIVKFDPAARVQLVMGRKPESVSLEGRGPGGGRGGRGATGAGIHGDNFNRPTDIAWDAAGNIFVADGYNNARVAKFDPTGKFLKSWGSKGAGEGQFDMPNSIATDAQGNVYVADTGNKRIQVFDNDGGFRTQFTNVGSPAAICISQGAHPYLYSSNSNAPDTMDNGEIYRMELDGKIVGRFGKAGKQVKQFGAVNEIDCRIPNTLYVGEVTNWRVQKLNLR